MNAEARKRLLEDYSAAAYSHIALSGLSGEIGNDVWDGLAEKWGAEAFVLIEKRISEESTKIEEAKIQAGLDAVEVQR